MVQNAIRWTGNFFVNRLLAGLWVPMLLSVVVSGLLAVTLGIVDAAGLTSWIGDLPGPFGFGHEGAAGMLDTLITVQVAILTLYFSITLLILTLAAQTLGPRLIERWIARVEIRATLAQWAGLVAFTLVAQAFVMPGTEGSTPPRATVLADLVFTLIGLGWIGFAYHRLVRTAHVDTSIAALGRTYGSDRQDWDVTSGPPPHDATDATVARAWTSGYLGGFDRGVLIRAAEKADGRIAILRPDGEFIIEGTPLAHIWGEDGSLEQALRKVCEIAEYRADRPTGPFSLSLLVELAARALSPGINDHQTAAACADWVGHGLCQRLNAEVGPTGWFTDEGGTPRLSVPESGVVPQSMPYLSVFARSARGHPFIEERLIRAFRSALAHTRHDEDRRLLSDLIDGLARPGEADGRTAYESARLAREVHASRVDPAATGALSAD